MSKVYGTEKVRRTCLVKGRESEGRFALLRKNLNVSKVLAPNQEESEDIETGLVYDERIAPRPARQSATKASAETKVYPADKQPRRLCFLDGKGDVKYHLLRKGAELSKVLEVGKEGKGDWVNTSQIRDEHLVPVPTKPRFIERKPVRICKLSTTGDQEYLILRKTDKGARLVPVYEGNYGQTVDPSMIVEERTIDQAKKSKSQTAPSENPATDSQAPSENGNQTVLESTQVKQDQAPAQAQAPVEAAPVQTQAPVQPQARPVQNPQHPQHAQHPQHVRPAQPGGQPRPAPVGAGAPRPQPQNRPQPR